VSCVTSIRRRQQRRTNWSGASRVSSTWVRAYDATLHAFRIVPMSLPHGFGIVRIEQDPRIRARALLHPEDVIAITKVLLSRLRSNATCRFRGASARLGAGSVGAAAGVRTTSLGGPAPPFKPVLRNMVWLEAKIVSIEFRSACWRATRVEAKLCRVAGHR
jgi:hypothetical protein